MVDKAVGEETMIGGFFKKYVYDPNDGQAVSGVTSSTAKAVPVTKIGAINAIALHDAEMVAMLTTKITTRKTPYIALVEAASKLADIIPDERLRLQAAFKMLDGRKASDIISAIEIHIADLESEKTRFKLRTDQEVKSRSGAMRDQASDATRLVMMNEQKITDLEKQIVELRAANDAATTEAHDLNTRADSQEADLRAVQTRFEASIDYLQSDLATKKAGIGAVLS